MTRMVKEESKGKAWKQIILGEQVSPEDYTEVEDTLFQQSDVIPEPFIYDLNKILKVVPPPRKESGIAFG